MLRAEVKQTKTPGSGPFDWVMTHEHYLYSGQVRQNH